MTQFSEWSIPDKKITLEAYASSLSILEAKYQRYPTEAVKARIKRLELLIEFLKNDDDLKSES